MYASGDVFGVVLWLLVLTRGLLVIILAIGPAVRVRGYSDAALGVEKAVA